MRYKRPVCYSVEEIERICSLRIPREEKQETFDINVEEYPSRRYDLYTQLGFEHDEPVVRSDRARRGLMPAQL